MNLYFWQHRGALVHLFEGSEMDDVVEAFTHYIMFRIGQ